MLSSMLFFLNSSNILSKISFCQVFLQSLCRPVIDWAKGNGAQQFLFVSSAGIYKTTDEPPHVEGVSNASSSLNESHFQ